MSITLARKRALPAIVILALFSLARIGAGIWMSQRLGLSLSSFVFAYGISAVVYAFLAYGVFRLWRWAPMAAIAYFWWQALATPGSPTRAALVLLIVTAILSTGVVAALKYHASIAEKREGATNEN